jgi:hypothetical protein
MQEEEALARQEEEALAPQGKAKDVVPKRADSVDMLAEEQGRRDRETKASGQRVPEAADRAQGAAEWGRESS